MPFFPRFQYPTHSSSPSSFFPQDLFRLFDDSAFLVDPTTSRRGFSPAFDVRELDHEYVLEGELPGLANKDNVALEFTDDRTLLVQGKIERPVNQYSDDQGNIRAIGAGEEQKKLAGSGENKDKEKEEGKVNKPASKKPTYWVSERSIGEFSRSFSFPSNVDVEKVKASLDHGILKIVVPKMEKRQGRKVVIS